MIRHVGIGLCSAVLATACGHTMPASPPAHLLGPSHASFSRPALPTSGPQVVVPANGRIDWDGVVFVVGSAGGFGSAEKVDTATAAVDLLKKHHGMPFGDDVVSLTPIIRFGELTLQSDKTGKDGVFHPTDANERSWLLVWPQKAGWSDNGGATLPGTPRAIQTWATGQCVQYIVINTHGSSPVAGGYCAH